jgi:hypothetical protein
MVWRNMLSVSSDSVTLKMEMVCSLGHHDRPVLHGLKPAKDHCGTDRCTHSAVGSKWLLLRIGEPFVHTSSVTVPFSLFCMHPLSVT